MQRNPVLIIDLSKIEHNARVVAGLCGAYDVSLAAVTKGFCAIPIVASAMLAGGCTMVADSRVKNLVKLREAHINTEYLLLRLPMLSEVEEVIQNADISLNSEIVTIKALNQAAQKLYKQHKIILMIDVGDLREGIFPCDLTKTVEAILSCEHLSLVGIGTNLGCFGGILPTPENMQQLLHCKHVIETTYHVNLRFVSAGNSCGLRLLASGKMPAGINHFRVGEAILLGRSTTDHWVIPWTYRDAFIIRAEIVECNEKPSCPIGLQGYDAFDHLPYFVDQGLRRRVILALGRQDIAVAKDLHPLDPKVVIWGATSDYTIVDITQSERPYQVGMTMEFIPDYGGLLSAATSEYIEKVLIRTPITTDKT